MVDGVDGAVKILGGTLYSCITPGPQIAQGLLDLAQEFGYTDEKNMSSISKLCEPFCIDHSFETQESRTVCQWSIALPQACPRLV